MRNGASKDAVLVLGGPWELMQHGAAGPEPKVLQTVVKAFGRMDYALGVLSGEESRMLQAQGLALSGWSEPGDSGRIEIIPSPWGRVAVISLPPLADRFVLPNQELIETVRALSASARAQADMVVAISPWGAQGERFLLEKTGPDIDLLLGSGPGPGVPGQLTNQARTLWARPYNKGQTVTRITVKRPASASAEHRWIQGGNFEFHLMALLQELPEEEEMNRLLSGLP